MRTGIQRHTAEDHIEPSIDPRGFSFTSGGRKLITTGVLQRIEAPAIGGQEAQSPFQLTIKRALQQARSAGIEHPMVVGAIPFDPSEASCLFVPEHAYWVTKGDGEADQPRALPVLKHQKNIPEEQGFKRAVEQAIISFRGGEVRKAVLSVQRELVFASDVDVPTMQSKLHAQNPTGYHFCVPMSDGGTLVGVSPELLIQKEGSQLVSNPLAGSARRMPDHQADQLNAHWLKGSKKDHYEHRLVIEDITARLEQFCRRLDVPATPSLISTAALWHLSTRIEGELHDPTITALQLACRLHPTPAVCGFPTERARHLIRAIEPYERGLFTGMVGWCDADGNGEWVVTIRCGTVHRNTVRLFAGAGIVEASCPDTEWTEVQTKLGTMLRACGLPH